MCAVEWVGGANVCLIEGADKRYPITLCHSGLRLVFQPISKPAVYDLPLVASPAKIEKVRPVRL